MAKVLVVNENHLQRTPDGKYWSKGVVDYQIFSRPLRVFDEVLVSLRVSDVEERDSNYIHRCDGENVKILPLPDYSGPIGYITGISDITKRIKKYVGMADCAIVRTPSAISSQFIRHIHRKIPYALEVSGDPWVWMAPGEYKSFIRPFARAAWTISLKRDCKRANGVSYVTSYALQKRYPCTAMLNGESKYYFTSHYSTVSIDGDIRYEAKVYKKQEKYNIIHVANAFTTYAKGHKETIDVIKKLNEGGINAGIKFIGEGPLRNEFYQYAKDQRVAHKTEFIGRLNSKEEVWEELRRADIFLFPTHSEGLPRVVIESLYVGTPVISTNVGGIPELLDRSCICRVGDVDRMTKIIKKMIDNPDILTRLSQKGIKIASEYMEGVLQARRVEFYGKLNDISLEVEM